MNGTGKSTVSKSLFAAINAREDLRGRYCEIKKVKFQEFLGNGFILMHVAIVIKEVFYYGQ